MPTELDFVTEYSKYENEVHRFILSLVPHRPDADELMQETARTLWGKYFKSAEPIKSFRAWACKIAFYEVMRFRQKKSRERLSFSTDVIEQLAAVREQHGEVLANRRAALTHCLQQLKAADISLLQMRYGIVVYQENDPSKKEPITNAISKRLQRIRQTMSDYVEKRMEGPLHA